jgi:hypothetical protein
VIEPAEIICEDRDRGECIARTHERCVVCHRLVIWCHPSNATIQQIMRGIWRCRDCTVSGKSS